MKRSMILFALVIAIISNAQSQGNIKWTPLLQQHGMYYSSGNITSEGFGLGLGVHMLHKTQMAGQADVNILWGNGNAVTTRFALGYEKKGTWTPAVYGTLNLVWGQRTELLSESGQQPPVPLWIIGIRITPLKFQTSMGYVSALELGYGFGPEKGMSLEFSILLVGIAL